MPAITNSTIDFINYQKRDVLGRVSIGNFFIKIRENLRETPLYIFLNFIGLSALQNNELDLGITFFVRLPVYILSLSRLFMIKSITSFQGWK